MNGRLSVFESMIITRNFSYLKTVIIEFALTPTVLASGGTEPTYDFADSDKALIVKRYREAKEYFNE